MKELNNYNLFYFIYFYKWNFLNRPNIDNLNLIEIVTDASVLASLSALYTEPVSNILYAVAISIIYIAAV